METRDELPPFPKDWQSDSRFDDLRKRVMTLIRQEFADAPVWGWKDPQTCLTLPFWKSLLPPMHYVICFRNPLDMARSLERRDGFSIQKGFHLWLLYTKAALKHTIGQRRIFVFSEAWISGWQHELRLLSEFLGIPGQAEQASVRSAVQALIDQNLWHYRSSANRRTRARRPSPASSARPRAPPPRPWRRRPGEPGGSRVAEHCR